MVSQGLRLCISLELKQRSRECGLRKGHTMHKGEWEAGADPEKRTDFASI